MRIWIDATGPESRLRIFGLTLVERQLRAIAEAEQKLRALKNVVRKIGIGAAERQILHFANSRIRPTEIWIEIPPDDPEPSWIPDDLTTSLPLRWMREPGSTRERLQRALVDAEGETVLAFSGDAVVDLRLVEHIACWTGGSAAFISEEGPESSAVMHLEGPLPELPEHETSLLEIARNSIKGGAVKELRSEDFDTYIEKLRRHLTPFLYRIGDVGTRDRIERFIFDSNYKGSTDFLTKWVYPPLVWRLLLPLTTRHVHPNLVTMIGTIACFAAVPFFAAGMWVPGLILAYVMSVLDSVDGKLARVTFKSTPQGDVLDHGTDLIHPPFWYWGWAWGLSGGDPFSGIVQASMWMAVFYIFDRVLEMLFRASTGKSIHGYTQLDARMRTFISRRNVNLALITLALPLGLGVEAFYFIVAWQAFSALYHLSRVAKFWNDHSNRAMHRDLGQASR
jgi:phosphatidylglycerophosphate synthase